MSHRADPLRNQLRNVLPQGYAEFLDGLKVRIRTAQVRAALAVNRELVALYWEIGRAVVERQEAEGWGRSVIERLAKDLQAAFPGVGGFSPSNVWRMRAFYLAYTADVRNLAQPVRELDGSTLPPAMAEIPWGHNILLVEKLDDPSARLWYARMTTEQGWSRSVLVLQIQAGAHHRHGKALTNFAATLIELKVSEFEPEHLGKMNFYLSAVDEQLRHPEDRPSIGLILCPAKNSIVVEYALRDTTKPIGVAGYTAGRTLPIEVRDQLPSPERLEEELRKRRPRLQTKKGREGTG